MNAINDGTDPEKIRPFPPDAPQAPIKCAVGILLEMHIYSILRRHFREDPLYVPLMELFHEVTLQTAVGQLLDLTTADPDKARDRMRPEPGRPRFPASSKHPPRRSTFRASAWQPTPTSSSTRLHSTPSTCRSLAPCSSRATVTPPYSQRCEGQPRARRDRVDRRRPMTLAACMHLSASAPLHRRARFACSWASTSRQLACVVFEALATPCTPSAKSAHTPQDCTAPPSEHQSKGTQAGTLNDWL